MPLDHSSSDAAFKRNVRTLMGEVGASPHVESRRQALAIAYALKRRGRAMGGAAPPWEIKSEARDMLRSPVAKIPKMPTGAMAPKIPAMGAMQRMPRGPGAPPAPRLPRMHMRSGGEVYSGPIVSDVPGRTDRHEMELAPGSYVIPAYAVSHLGQNNTLAGFRALDGIVRAIHHGKGLPAPRVERARGGPVDVVTAGGEYVVTPQTCALIGDGDVDAGHRKLDDWVNRIRSAHIRTLEQLPGPAKS